MSTRNRKIMFLGSKARAVRKADNLNAIFELTVKEMWDPRRPTTLWASMACFRDSSSSSSIIRGCDRDGDGSSELDTRSVHISRRVRAVKETVMTAIPRWGLQSRHLKAL
jgi:hypothetical protein